MDRDLSDWKIVAWDRDPDFDDPGPGIQDTWLVAVGDSGRGRIIDENLRVAFPEQWLASRGPGFWPYTGPQDILPALVDRVTVCDTAQELNAYLTDNVPRTGGTQSQRWSAD